MVSISGEWIAQSETPGTQHRLCFSSVLDDSFNQTVLVCVLRLLLHSNTSVQINFHKLLKSQNTSWFIPEYKHSHMITWNNQLIVVRWCCTWCFLQDNQTWKSCLDGTWLSAALMVYSRRMEVDGEYCEECVQHTSILHLLFLQYATHQGFTFLINSWSWTEKQRKDAGLFL